MEYIPTLNFLLNLAILPLLKILWDLKIEMVKLNVWLKGHEGRIDRLEREMDRSGS